MATERILIEVTERGARVVKRNLEEIGQVSDKSSGQVLNLKNALAALGIGISIQQVVTLADSYTNLLNRLRLVTTGTENLTAVTRELFELSNRTRSSFAATGELYSKFATATERLGISQAHLLQIVENVNKATILSGVSAVNAEQGLRQLAQGIASGVLRGDELTSILENLPKVASVIAEGMGATVGDLKKLGEQGKITAKDIIDAFDKAGEQLGTEFLTTVPTIGSALTVLQNNLLRTFGEMDQGTGLSAALAQGIISLSGNMDVLIRSAIAAALALGVSYAVQGVGAAIAATRALTLAIAANPLGAIAKGVVVAVAALAAFSDQIRLSKDSTANLADFGSAAFESLKRAINNVVTFARENFPQISAAFSSAFGSFDFTVRDMVLGAGRGIDAIIGAFRGFGNTLPIIMKQPLNAVVLLFTETFNSILRSFAAWMNMFITTVNNVRSTLGMTLIDQVKAVQIPLSQGAAELGKTISDSIAKGIKEQNSVEKELNKILDRADAISKERLKTQGGKIGTVGTPPIPPLGGTDGDKKAEQFLKSLREEEIQLGKTQTAIKLLKAEELGILDKARPIIESIEAKTRALDAQEEATRKLKQDLDTVKRITEDTQTPQERLNAQIAEFNRLLSLPNGQGLTITAYNRAVKAAQEEFEKTKRVARDAFGSIDQYAIQAARNIQTSLANFLFDPFEDGLDGMVKGVANAVRRMVAEFAAMKIAHSIGLPELFGFGSGGPGSGRSGGSGFADIASFGSNVLSMFNSGGRGLVNGIGRVGSMLPGSVGSFFGGMGGTGAAAARGAQALWGASGLSGAAGMGASAGSMLGAVAGPAAIAMIATQVLKGLAGDKRMGGGFGKGLNAIGDIPIIGDLVPVVPLMNMLFGHGPMKFRQEAAIGTASAGGFDGRVTDVFRAKGGLLVGNKHQEQSSPREQELLRLFDTTISGFGQTVRSFAQNLELDTSSVDNFSKVIDLRSEKTKRITEEAITELLDSIGNEIAGGVLKQIDVIGRNGETNIQTLTRLSGEFDALNLAALATGRSLNEARAAVLAIPVAIRTSVIDKLGGIDSAKEDLGFFIDTFLTDAERLKPMFEGLDIKMRELGFSANISREEFKRLIQAVGQAGGATEDQAIGLVRLAREYDLVKTLEERVADTSEDARKATEDMIDAERALADSRSGLLSGYQKERSELQSVVTRFQDLAGKIKDFREGLALSELSPLTPGQKLDEARLQFNQVRSLAAQGDADAMEKLPTVAQEFLKASQTYNASSGAFISDFKLVTEVLKNAENSAVKQKDIAQEQLVRLDDSVSQLIDINENTKDIGELLRDFATNTLKGPGNAGITTQQIKDFIAANPGMTPQQIGSAAVKNGVSLQQLQDAGVGQGTISGINQILRGETVSDKQILDFINSGASLRQIYDAAQANGVTFARLSKVTGVSVSDMEKWAKDNNLPVLERGTDFVSRSGIAMLHQGEAVVPSTMTDEMRAVRNELAQMRAELKEQNDNVVRITAITNAKNAEEIVKSNVETVHTQEWKKRSGTRRR